MEYTPTPNPSLKGRGTNSNAFVFLSDSLPLREGWGGGRGYTLVEVIVTMTIFMVLASITFAQNPQGFDKIRFNTYTHELIINMKQLQIFGAAAGDVLSERVTGAGIRFTKSNAFFVAKPATPFYDKASTGVAAENNSARSSNLLMDTGEQISTSTMPFAYENKVKVDFICSESQFATARIDNTFAANCNSNTADALIIRPNTKFNVFLDSTVNPSTGQRDIDHTSEGNVLYIQLSYANIDSKKCISIKDNIISIISNADHEDYGCRSH